MDDKKPVGGKAFDELARKLARVERDAVVAMRRRQEIGDEAMREIEREIDLLEARIVPR